MNNNGFVSLVKELWSMEEQPPTLHRKEYSFLELILSKFQYNIQVYCIIFMTSTAIVLAIALQVGEVSL